MNTDILTILLKKPVFENVTAQEVVEQIEAKKKCKTKLKTWFETAQIYYPNKLNIEQTSSEITAQYKAKIVTKNSLIDLSGGFGVDSFFFAKKMQKVTHCEINETLSKIVKHNFEQLKVDNIECISTNGINYLKNTNQTFDWIYVDPSRRDDQLKKVFFLKDCLPNVPEHIDLLFSKSDNILIKTSPLLDLKAGINELQNIKAIHIVAVNNEVKELLWHLEKDYSQPIEIKTVNIGKTNTQHFDFTYNSELDAVTHYELPQAYIYEPNVAILKSGAFKTICEQLNINKLQQNTHLYTHNTLIDFPGRKFELIQQLPYNKKQLLKVIKDKKANITTRNFPETVAQIRKKTGIKDGGSDYLFFTTNKENKPIVLVCKKA